MKRLAAYTLYCVVVIGLFAYGQFFGRSLLDDLPDQPSSGQGGGGGGGGSGFFFTGSSGGSHK